MGNVTLERAAGALLTLMAELSEQGAKPGDRGARPCPVCGARLVWALVPHRGMGIRVLCETPDCLRAMS